MFSGHTECFMQQSGCEKVVMMLANQAMKVALVTTHLPLKDIPAAITADNVRQTVQIVIDDMREKFGLAQPRILVCGLNPRSEEHTSELQSPVPISYAVFCLKKKTSTHILLTISRQTA